MKFKSQNGEIVNVSNVTMRNGRIFFSVRGKGCGSRFYTNNPAVIFDEEAADGTYLRCAEGWELADGQRQPRQPRHSDSDSNNAESQPQTNEPTQSQSMTSTATATATDDAIQLAAILSRMKGGAIDENAVRSIAREVLSELLQSAEPAKVTQIKMRLSQSQDNADRKIIDTVKMMVVNDRVIGRYPWLYGPAGSGKSTMCRQIADELGLPFYSVSSLMQKYELEGYTDAAGQLVQTSFYQAFKNGGIFVFDEASTSSAEVQVAFNTAAAQLIYNFPHDGMITAHPDFHIIAADNSIGRGGDRKYSARYKLDVSTLDRYTFVEVGYSEAHDMRMADGDTELVKFMRDLRVVLDEANTEYIASPRASRAIKALQAGGMSDRDAVWYGLCSGWKRQDIKTFAARMHGSKNKYTTEFINIANKL